MRQIAIEEFLEQASRVPVFDVRSPGEFAQGHIPGAMSLPLFDDSERATVGTLYKQSSRDEAMLAGLEIAGSKMRRLVEQARELTSERRVLIHCWRGGQRSQSVAWLLEFAGFEVSVLNGGYKAFRTAAMDELANDRIQFLVLGGQTGSGKTDILHQLARLGEQVVDLEGLAQHKGSAFGWIGEQPQPTSEQFLNDLFLRLIKLDPSRPVWIENESRGIGRVFLTDPFAARLRNGTLVNIQVDLQSRVDRLIRMYAHSKAELKASFEKIERKLGGQHLKAALAALDQDDFATATEIALVYYDKTYQHSLDRANPPTMIEVDLGDSSVESAAERLLELKNEIQAAI